MKTLFGQPIPALTFGQLKANSVVVDGLTAAGLDPIQRTENCIVFLKLVFPDGDFDTLSPGAIQAGAADLYSATFARPEDAAPVPQNP